MGNSYKFMITSKIKFITNFVALFLVSGQIIAQMCPATPGTELITNGNFEAGNTGFTNTGLTYCPGTCTPMGTQDTYFVTTNPNNQNNTYFKSMTDHTPGAGNDKMLLFDFNNASTNDPIYTVSVPVTAGKVYFFSAWFANIAQGNTTACGSCPGGQYITNSPILKFRINGVDQGTVKVDSITNNWNQYFTTWTAAATTSITIEIVNLRGGLISNDLALDDISFTDGCDKIANLNSIGQSSALPDTVLNCNVDFAYNLNPGLPGTYGYKWKLVPGATLATTTTYNVPPTPADGTKYYLCYEAIAGCPRTDSVLFRVTPISIEVGSDKIICAPVNYTINSGYSSAAGTIVWKKNTVTIAGATSGSYTATTAGTYEVTVTRPGCGSATDQMTISNPVSTISGSGTYCSGTNTSSFTVSGSSSVEWYIDNVSSSILSTSTTYTPAYSATNQSVPGCASGLYVKDASSYPGTLIPASSVATAPCGSNSNYNGNADLFIEVNQSLNLTSVDYFQNSGWGNGTFTFSIFANSPTGGPWCPVCSPNGSYNNPTGAALYTTTTAILTAPGSGSLQRTLPVSYTLAPGNYWFRLSASGTAMGAFTCNSPLIAGTDKWVTPYLDNTGNNAIRGIGSIYNNAGGSGNGALFNIKFQVGSSNACSRLFICATSSCVAPVEMLSFDVKKYSNGNSLLWKTASEQNSSYFEIERSTDGANFTSIGKTAAAGNSNVVTSYNFLDNNAPSAEIIYYRLKQVDINGETHYSEIKTIRNDEPSSDMNIYPVPVKKGENASLEYMSSVDETILVEIYDNPGKVVSANQYQVTSGTNILELNSSALASGLYYLRVTGSSGKTAKFIVE
jgi:hypothetical protein